jgi:hypothetical protein
MSEIQEIKFDPPTDDGFSFCPPAAAGKHRW